MKPHVVTLVLTKTGRHHLTIENMSTEDAERWAEEGYHVFRAVIVDKQWAMNHVNSGQILTSEQKADEYCSQSPLLLLTGGGK